ncbi:hypothetical protein FRC07_007318, partial [Ceratobasidium sp. 392]
MDVQTNTFCAAGMHFPNGSWATFGGNGAVAPGGGVGSVPDAGGAAGLYDSTYQNWDGRRAIRILNPCASGTAGKSPRTPQCQWFDNTTYVGMQKARWYASAEALADGGTAAAVMQFMITTSGLNSYAHLFLMPSGRMFAQANYSTIMWDYNSNTETPLPDMPGRVVRVYPASGAVAMLPLTPGNNYTPTILFCGGSDMPEPAWGNYSYPAINTWNYPASRDCQRITPESPDNSPPVYVKDDEMLEGRTMGQFIALPDSTLLVINGALNGTAGYAQMTGETPTYGQMPFGMSLASGPVLTPAIYDPNAPLGQRWRRFGQPSSIPRLYHSTALLLPDGSVLVAGSNPNVDVNFTTAFPTTYAAERFYPPYFANISSRPVPDGMPDTLSYGGAPFVVSLPVGSYAGDPNEAATSTRIMLIRPGFSTHAMNMGQRALQLNSSFQVAPNGLITMYVAQVPPNPNLLTPGPVLMFVVVGGVPSMGKMVMVGTGNIGAQPVQAASALPPSYTRTNPPPVPVVASGQTSTFSENTKRTIGIAAGVGGAVVLGILIALVWLIRRRRREQAQRKQIAQYAPSSSGSETLPPSTEFHPASSGRRSQGQTGGMRENSSASFVPLWRQHQQPSFEGSGVWTPPHSNSAFDSSVSLNRPMPVMARGSSSLPPGAMAPWSGSGGDG